MTSTTRKTSTISLIIPCLNDQEALGKTLSHLQGEEGIEVIVADGGSHDSSRKIAETAGAHVVDSPPGRGRQLNQGAAAAGGDILFFLHADTIPPAGFATLIRASLSDKGVAAGSFSLALDMDGRRARLVCLGTNLRSRLFSLPYGDQGFFISREIFNKINGFPEQELMEDYEFIRRAGKLGRIKILPEAVTSSARRWRRLGFLKTTLLNQMMVLGYLLGVSPASLARRYRRSLRSGD